MKRKEDVMRTQIGGPDDFDAAHVAAAALAKEVSLALDAAIEEVEEILANGARGEQLRLVNIFVDILKDSRMEYDSVEIDSVVAEWRASAAAIAMRLDLPDLALEFRKDSDDILTSLFGELAVELAWVVRRRYGRRFLHAIIEMWRASPFVLVIDESALLSIEARLATEEDEADGTSEAGGHVRDEALS